MKNDLRAFRAYLNGEIEIGRDIETGRDVYIPIDALKETHVHVVGPSGSGKTRWMMHVIRALIERGLPFGVLSPHRDLFDFTVSALCRSAKRAKNVVIFDPADERFSVAFNPLQTGLADPGDQASMVLEACLKAWAHASFDSFPRLERMLRGTFVPLATNGQSMLEAYEFLNVDNVDYRAALLSRTNDDLVRADWQEFEKLSRTERLAIVESSRNRLQRFFQHGRIRRMIGQTENTLDLFQTMERGDILAANLAGLPPESQRLLGSLLLGAVYHGAKRRDPKRRKPWFFIIDEAAQFLTPDLANSLDECRKFGLVLIAGHQRLCQLQREDSDLASALLTNARCKVVFGGLERPEAERMAKELFTGDVRGDRVKHINVATKFRPVHGTFEVETETWLDSDSEGESMGVAESVAESSQDSEGATFDAEDGFGDAPYSIEDLNGRSRSANRGWSRTGSTSSSRTSQHSASRGGSRSVVPITRFEESVEETGRQFWSVEEEWEQRIGLLHRLPRREMLFRLFDGPVYRLRTPDVELESRDKSALKFKERALQHNPHVKPTATVLLEIEDRKERVRRLVEGSEARRPPNVNSFREKRR
jgi:hypothetical protein